MNSIRILDPNGNYIDLPFTNSDGYIDEAVKVCNDFVCDNARDPDFIITGESFAYNLFREISHRQRNVQLWNDFFFGHGSPKIVIVPDPYRVSVSLKAVEQFMRIDWRRVLMSG